LEFCDSFHLSSALPLGRLPPEQTFPRHRPLSSELDKPSWLLN
jgi:hypothetical protein